MKNRILRSALSVALCAAMLLSQGLTVFADGEIDLAAAKSSPVQESSEESEAKTPTETLTPETKKELPASTEDETKTETTTGQPTAEDDTAKETTAKTPAVVSEEEKSEEATAAPAEAQAATNSLKSNWGNGCPEEKTWDIKDAEVPVEIHVICEPELPSIPDSILEKIWVDMNCTEDDKHDTLKYTNLASVSPLDYSIEYNKDEGTATVSLLNLDEWVRLYDVQDKVKHTFTVSNPPTIGLKYNSENGWQLEDKSKNTFVIEIACDAFDKDNFISFIEQSVKVQIECVNENRLHNSETITWPLEEGSYSRGYWKIDDVVVNEQGGYTATITVDPSYCLDDYNKDNGEHYLVLHNSILSLAFNFNAASETWEPVEQHDFYLPVTCNVPAVPTYKDLEELLGNMTVYCVNENHLVSKAYPITWNTIGGLNQKPVQNDDGTFSMEITVSYDPFKDLFDDEFGPHDYVENIELARSVVSLKWSKDVGTWIVDGSFINSFNVICDTTSGGGEDPGTNPGGDENPDNPGGGDNGNNGGNNNGGSTGGGSSVSRRDDDDDWEPLPNNNYRVTKKNDKPSQNTQIVLRDPADNSDNTSSNTGSDSGKHNPETGDTTTAFAAMALAAVSLGGVVLLGRKKK